MTKTYTQSEIKTLIATNDRAAMRGVAAIFQRQTAREKGLDVTIHVNDIGFSQAHALMGSALAKEAIATGKLEGNIPFFGPVFVKGGRVRADRVRSEFRGMRKIDVARHIAMRYSRQLTDIANGGCRVA
jgi:hypothetical protein